MTCPWDFSKAPAPDEGVPNPTSPEGAALGEQIARLCDIEGAEQLKRFPGQLPRCNDCAARKGTRPNQTAETLMDFVKCTIEGVPFYCHKGVREGEPPKHICSGWMILQSSRSADRIGGLIAARRAREERIAQLPDTDRERLAAAEAKRRRRAERNLRNAERWRP